MGWFASKQYDHETGQIRCVDSKVRYAIVQPRVGSRRRSLGRVDWVLNKFYEKLMRKLPTALRCIFFLICRLILVNLRGVQYHCRASVRIADLKNLRHRCIDAPGYHCGADGIVDLQAHCVFFLLQPKWFSANMDISFRCYTHLVHRRGFS